MSCGTLQSGNQFLGSALAQVDCHAQAIGAYGFGALSAPGSVGAALLLAALTVFIALLGIRLMFGEAPSGRDLVNEALKVGIVLTLATSWPAWRTLAYDTVFGAPAQLSATIGGSAGLPGSGRALDQRLSSADANIVALTAYGTGRLTGGVVGSSDTGDPTRGIALADQTGFSWGRVFFLVGALGPLALVRLSGGILLALAPVMACLLLFVGTRDIFIGWLRALGAVVLGALALSLCQSVQLALLEGWFSRTLEQRQANILTVSAPTELLVISLSFALIAFGALGLAMRLSFFSGGGINKIAAQIVATRAAAFVSPPAAGSPGFDRAEMQPRAQRLADAIAETVRREERASGIRTGERRIEARLEAAATGTSTSNSSLVRPFEALGSSFSRNSRRQSGTAARRDRRT